MAVFTDFQNVAFSGIDPTNAGEDLGNGGEGALLEETRVYTDFYGRAFQICFASKGASGHGGGTSPQHLSQFMSSSQDTPFQIYRFSSGVSRLILRARVLGEDYE